VKVSIIIPVWNGREVLPACLDALLAQGYPNFEVIVVDNASADGSADFVSRNYSQVRLIRNRRNLGFARGCNVGLRAAQGDAMVLLNQDTVAQAGWLEALVSALSDPQVGVAGCKILETDGKTLNHCGGSLDIMSARTQHRGAGEPDEGQYDEAVDVEYVTGAALAVRRDVLEHVGLLDERFFPGYYEDADFCLRVREAGFRIRYAPDAVVIHHVSTSTHQHWVHRRFYYYRNRLLFALKHLTPAKFVTQFVLSEREGLCELSPGELHAAQIALTEVLAQWPSLATELKGQILPQEVEQVSYSLRSLLDFVVWQRGANLDLSPIVSALDMERSLKEGAIGTLVPVIEDMSEAWQIQDRPFRSQVPLIGPLIAAVRTAWNSVSAKWYVLALFQQQMHFNLLANRAICALAAHLWDGDSAVALLTERCGMLTRRVAELEARLAQIEGQSELPGERGHE
jgi:GT2 family glycosyltransferase